MHDSSFTVPPDRQPADLGALLVDTLRRLRLARLLLRRSREKYREHAELLSVALKMVRDRDRQFDRLSDQHLRLVNEYRCYRERHREQTHPPDDHVPQARRSSRQPEQVQ